jgi:hypothetical protein
MIYWWIFILPVLWKEKNNLLFLPLSPIPVINFTVLQVNFHFIGDNYFPNVMNFTHVHIKYYSPITLSSFEF